VLRARLLPAGRPGTWRPVWGDEGGERLAAALEELRSPSLFGGPQVVAVRRAEALRDDDQEQVLGALPALEGGGGTLILVTRTADQRKRLFATCVRAGAAVGFAPVDPRTAHGWVTRLAREQGAEIALAAAQELVDRTGTDLGILSHEVEKLVACVGPGARIETSHVRAVVSAVRAHAVEELADRLARRDVTGAVRALRHLLGEGEAPLRVLGFLAANVRRTLHVAELEAAGARPDDIAARLGMPPWLVGKIVGRGRPADLARALHTLRRLDEDLKSPRPSEATFEEALLTIAGASEQPAG
jgi:DNA polymerase-3 subunit delta